MHPIDWLNSDTLELPKHWGGGDFPSHLDVVFKAFYLRAASGRQRFKVLGAWDAMTRQLITVTNTTVVTIPVRSRP